ncbi:MAG: 16S rRNA (cytosine(1402)-N(4))-methyltransferase RsmH [Clostridiales bacterium]|nr:16S rRNA (cytosine(1402)-N(4))-methyltransferase RsmH [Clostridiales bacterium]
MNEFFHISILLAPCLDALRIRPDGVYIDATLGGAGHSRQIADRLTAGGTLLCIDRDDEALQNAETKLAPVRERVRLCKSDFRRLDEVLAREGFSGADGILFDLGVSSPQLDEGYRGFSYMQDAPLDMRMDRQQSLTAYDVVNGWSRDELRRILFEYGEERYAPLIAAAIEREREKKPIETTLELVSIIRSAMPAKALREKQHPAKRSFQAIRIAVNDELGAVAEAMDKAIDVLKPGGRLAVITFHSLEDRIVKTAFQKAAQGCTCPKDFPVCVCGKKPKVKIITRKPIVPDSREVAENARARSAKLRVCEKLGADGR